MKWECLLCAVRQRFADPITTTRGLCDLPQSLVDSLTDLSRGDTLFWAALSSTTLDPAISRHYAEQPAAAGRGHVLFRIEGVTEGIKLEDLSQYPDEREFLLPLFSELEVVEVQPGTPPLVACKFKGTLITNVSQRGPQQ